MATELRHRKIEEKNEPKIEREDDSSMSKDDVMTNSSSSDSESENEDPDKKSSIVLWYTTQVSYLCAVVAAIIIAYRYSLYLWTLHENRLWFSNIEEVEREISFRTESGLYYSYYKQMVQASSVYQGLYELTHDNITENWRTINVLERMNIYQEVILSIVYRTLNAKTWIEPIYFYIDSVFALHGVYIVALYCTAWVLSGSWVTGVLAAAFFIFNKADTTRVEFTIPLRESFAIPFLFTQIAFVSYYLRPHISTSRQKVSHYCIGACTFLFVLTWQFAQFLLLLQAMALFALALVDIIPYQKVKCLFGIQVGSLLLVCMLQFFHPMILGSLVLSFIPAALISLHIKESKPPPCGIIVRIFQLVWLVMSVLGLTLAINKIIKTIINIEADEHIFKFLSAKFGISHTRDFDANLYLCVGAFDYLPMDTFQRLTSTMVFPLYAIAQVTILFTVAIAVLQILSKVDTKENRDEIGDESQSDHILSGRPELAFHGVQTILFGCMAITTMRFKYIWTPEVCVLAAVAVGDHCTWKYVLERFNVTNKITVEIVRHAAVLVVFIALIIRVYPDVVAELAELREFYDPDTVALMDWIKYTTKPTAVFSGSMQLLAGVKLCTGRRLTNHPHYEDKLLRQKTFQLYQYYGRRDPQEVYEILQSIGTDYIILEDSICYSRGPPECTLPYLVDMANGHMTDEDTEKEGLVQSKYGRFCDRINKKDPLYTKLFQLAFQNKTFRVFKLL